MWPGYVTAIVTTFWATHAVWSICHSSMWTMAAAPLIVGRAFLLSDPREHPSTSGEVIPFVRAQNLRDAGTRQAPDVYGTRSGEAKVVKLRVTLDTGLPER